MFRSQVEFLKHISKECEYLLKETQANAYEVLLHLIGANRQYQWARDISTDEKSVFDMTGLFMCPFYLQAFRRIRFSYLNLS